MTRRVIFGKQVTPNLRDLYPPSDDEVEAIFNAIQELQTNPTLGVELYFPGESSKLYQLEVGRYKINYSFTSSTLMILFIGY